MMLIMGMCLKYFICKQIFNFFFAPVSLSNIATADEVTSSVLRLETLESDQYGDYYCKASNKVGHAEARINLFGINLYFN